MAIPLIAIAAALGAYKAMGPDRDRYEKEKRYNAIKEANSPFTGEKGQLPTNQPDALGTTAQFGLTGAELDQNIKANENNSKLTDAMTKYYDRGNAGSIPAQQPQMQMAPQQSPGMQRPGIRDFNSGQGQQYGMNQQNPWSAQRQQAQYDPVTGLYKMG